MLAAIQASDIRFPRQAVIDLRMPQYAASTIAFNAISRGFYMD